MTRRVLLVLGFSALVGGLFLPLGGSGWAERVREKRTAQREARQRGERPRRPRREPPPLWKRVAGPALKQTVLMGVPAGLVVLLSLGIRRVSRRREPQSP